MNVEAGNTTGDPGGEAKARRYGRLQRWLGLAGWLLDAGLLVALLAAGWSTELRDVAYQASGHRALALLVYLGMLAAIFEVIDFPLSFLSEYAIERRFGLSRMSLGGWAKEQLKSMAIGGLLGAAIAELFYWALQNHPSIWWLVVAGVLILFGVLMAQLAPVLLFPLFFKFRPLENQELTQRLRSLSERVGARVATVLEWRLGEKTRKANAALAGWGKTRRILLADTLLEKHTPDEIETIVAHELAHHVHHDIPKAIALESALTLLSLWVVNRVLVWATPLLGYTSLADFANLPLVLLVVTAVTLVALPLVNGYSRWRERMADRFALDQTRNRDAFISAMRKLAEQNLAETQPNRVIEFLFHSHPSIARRIAAAEQTNP